MTAAPGTPADDAPIDRRALLAVLVAVALSTLDAAIANTALPVIAADLKIRATTSIWIVNAYQLAVLATLLPFAALGDLHGPRRVYLCGLATFTLASVGCTLASDLPALVAARALQGLGASAVMSVNIALIKSIYPPARLGRGVGLNALVVGVAFAAGPSIASLILAFGPWPWLFAINLPLGALALALAWPALPRSARRGQRFDPLAAALVATTFGALLLALGAAAQRDRWPWIAAPLLVSCVCGWLLARREAGRPAPMLPLDLLRRPMFALSAMTSVSAFTAQGLAFVALPFYFTAVLNRDAVETGLLMTPWPIVVALAAPVCGRLSDRHPPGLLGGIGMALLCLGMASLAALPASPSTSSIVVRMAVCGAGFGLFQSPNLRAMMSSAPPERSGGASGSIAVARITGQALGAALVALCLGLDATRGPVWALALGAAFAALATCTSLTRLRVD